MTTVLVTGGSGFIGVHCIVQLLKAGHRVRATLRSLARVDEVRSVVREGGAEAGEALTFVVADLGADAGWRDAAEGCEFAIHPASPTPAVQARHDDDFLIPAREGVLRLLRASRDAGVRRVVFTSAFGAVVWSKKPKVGPYLKTDWSDVDASVPLYQRSKTVSERAAWDFIAREGGALELSVVNPVAVLGPVLGPDPSHSIGIVKQFLSGGLSGSPRSTRPTSMSAMWRICTCAPWCTPLPRASDSSPQRREPTRWRTSVAC
jgi:dihydroflavonol-4-reductase